MVLAVIVGVIVGLLSTAPFSISSKKIRGVNPEHSLALLAPFLLTIISSLVILLGAMIICKLVFPDFAIPFAIAEFVAFVVGVIVFGTVLSKR